MTRNGELPIVRAARKDLEDLVALFDGYRQFYGQLSDTAAARAFLGERVERDESVIYLAYTGPREPAGFTQLYASFSSVSLKPLWILNAYSSARMIGAAASVERYSNGRDSMRSRPVLRA